MIPQDEYPEINFVGLLIGPRWAPRNPGGVGGLGGHPLSFTPGMWAVLENAEVPVGPHPKTCRVLGWVSPFPLPLPGLFPLINTGVFNYIPVS